MYYISFSDRIFVIEYSFMWISRGISFYGAVLVKVFEPPFECTTSILYPVQLLNTMTISRLFPTLSFYHVSGRIQLMVILFISSDYMKPTHICNIPITLLPLPPRQLSFLENFNYMCPNLPQL